jgi:gluconate 2-dehydrogenase gamma chain
MDRRKSLKIIAGTAIAGGAALAGCSPADKKIIPAAAEPEFRLDRSPDELKHEKELLAQGKFFTEHELATITVLADIIIPADEVSGSASNAKVPELIEFIVKDMPQHQVPLRGGIKWLDMQCFKQYENPFTDCTTQQQITMIDEIAYPDKAKSGVKQGVAFFSLLRNLVATGFYTSEIGVKDIGHSGNEPHQWNGVPEDVLKQFKLSYSERELNESVKFN